ncbi:hypothetical protein DFR29_102355 [Tahibacter aquaticus]|uniref:Parallel beta helix pectate lyase-like protein n=1 Tax=Tahibacter aquaticus TaxID=520092 RepID=A0A4R6Z7F2_9GAMM|nr:hypothetical protein [Tahibacter aquaticus]TDR47695.1 hypothetical protein DFR29_102355 [Tahibacter aquaticus]
MSACKHTVAASLAAIGLAFAAAAPAQVVITQASVMAGGITAGDTPGFPATLDTTGSYILGSNLNSAGLSAITISGRNVSLNLNGFTVDGGNRCEANFGLPSTGNDCHFTKADELALIDIVGPHARVRNGSVIGSTGKGISVWGENANPEHIFSGHQLSDLVIAHNRDYGLYVVDQGGQVSNVKAYLNGSVGLFLSLETGVENLSVSRNGEYGIYSNGRLNGRQIVSTLNGVDGVFSDSGLLSLAESSFNANDGFYGSTILANSGAYGNGMNGVEFSNLTHETVLVDNVARSYIAGIGGCYARLYRETSSTVSPQVQGGTPLHGSVTTCP